MRDFLVSIFAVLYLPAYSVEIPADKFVGTFSNGVSVEFVGIGMHPSAGKDWWRPDGSKLPSPPYSKINANMNPGPGGMAREACWRWHGIGEADVQTSWGIDPSTGGGATNRGKSQGTPEETLDKIAFIFNSAQQQTCTFRFTITIPATEWTTTIENQAGHASSIGRSDPAIGAVGASFLPQHADGPDTIVAVAFKIPNREVRLAGVDRNGVEHVAQTGSGGGMSDYLLKEFRIRNLVPGDIVTWRLQSRIRQEEVVEFRSVSLDPKVQTEVGIFSIKPDEGAEAPALAATGTLQLSPTAVGTLQFTATPLTPADLEAQRKADQERHQQRQKLIEELAEKHGYKLSKGELLKYISDPQNEERGKLYDWMMGASSVGEWMTGVREEKYEPFMLLFQANDKGLPELASAQNGIITLAEVLEHVLQLRRQEFECPSGLLMTYMPGDWILSWDPRQDHEVSDGELAAFEKILNEQLDLGVRCQWKTVEQPTLVVSGKYKPAPKFLDEDSSPEVSSRSVGNFEIPARRSDISASVGKYHKFLKAVGEVLMLPVIDEAETRPGKKTMIWQHTGQPTPGDKRLTPEVEKAVLETLHEQLGYDFRIEQREVKLLSIEP